MSRVDNELIRVSIYFLANTMLLFMILPNILEIEMRVFGGYFGTVKNNKFEVILIKY
jgi:hypothetical protein